MAFSADVRPDQRSKRSSCRTLALATGAVALAAVGVIEAAAPAVAQPLLGTGSSESAEEIPLPGFLVFPGLPGFTPPPAPEPEKSLGERAVDAALTKLGAPYVGGAAGPSAFDCSGLVQWSYRQAGQELPRTSYEQLAAGSPTSQDDLRPGDVVSFYGGSHSALYAGDGNVIHAATYGTGVKLAPISSMPYAGARRF
ncbi:C40 family peptidase [Nocardia sp. NBC_01730]|uniref:C40 family peptidase n=1 Tax=Nocardia sp. NBC_01730 TaxID=2975998 RepID=UPI002E0DC67D|nr:C40 family peptidase [Nocardia sp. NBC_01730]